MAETAAELIQHLEGGGVIAKGDPEHIEFLRFEMYETSAGLQKYLGVYGWGSALDRPADLLADVLREPYKWVKVEPLENAAAIEKAAATELEKIKKWDAEELEWRLTAGEMRGPNNRRAQTSD